MNTTAEWLQASAQTPAEGAHGTAPAWLVTFVPGRDTVDVSAQPGAFHKLYSRYSAEVYRFAYWLSGNAEDAQEITSETFVRVWTAPEEPRMDTVKAYFFAIARNLHRKQFRRQSRLTPFDQQTHESADPAAAPDQAAMNQEDSQRALRALQTLPELERTVLLLRAEAGLSYEEIAAATGLSVPAARVRVFRARAKIATLLNPNTQERL